MTVDPAFQHFEMSNVSANLKYFSIDFVRAYASTIPRSFEVRYNAYTQSVEVLESMAQIRTFATDLRSEFYYNSLDFHKVNCELVTCKN